MREFFLTVLLALGLVKASPSPLRIIFLDVGQGDSVLFIAPNGETLLIDGGPNTDADWILQDYVSQYFCKLNLVLLTHPDADHVSGLVRVAEHCYIDMIFHDYVPHDSFVYKRWNDLSSKSQNMQLYVGDKFSMSNVDFYVVWPPEDLQDEDTNDHSMSVLLDYGKFEALFMGDLENARHPEVFQNLQKLAPIIDRPFDLLKATHHGAANGLDKDLTAWLDPEVFVISVGADNTYGHPNLGVLEFMESLGSKIFRTDKDGTIEISVE